METMLVGHGNENGKSILVIIKVGSIQRAIPGLSKTNKVGCRWAHRTFIWPNAKMMDTETEGQKSDCIEKGLIG